MPDLFGAEPSITSPPRACVSCPRCGYGWPPPGGISLVVLGKPQTAGSKRSFVPINKRTGEPFRDPRTGRVIVNTVDDNPETKAWQQSVASQARLAWSGGLLSGPLEFHATFFGPRPQGHFGTGRNEHVLKASAPPYPITRPDCLKMARAVEDALTEVLWRDDAQGVDLVLRKRFGTPARAEIEIGPAAGTVMTTAAPDPRQEVPF